MLTKTHFSFISDLIAKGGPDPEDYAELDQWNLELRALAEEGKVTEEDRQQMVELMGDALSTETMQGFAYHKPHGYAGDFEIIDRIYTRYTSPREHLRKWDEYFHHKSAPQAVRNRKELFIQTLDALGDSPKKILNIASGPARDVHDWMAPGKPPHHITCLDMDPKAIQHATWLVGEKLKRLNGQSPDIKFIVGNALRFKPEEKYDLIWSGGLFDYFSDRVFTSMIRKLTKMINPGGVILVGNFGLYNPSRPYMEFVGEWVLQHRSETQLRQLAIDAGVSEDRIDIFSEEAGVNLFLRVRGSEENGGTDHTPDSGTAGTATHSGVHPVGGEHA
jgi:SAM-dependent methyltransferase